MIKFAVCDDELDTAEYVSDKLSEYFPDKCEIKKYTESKELLEDSKHEIFDALFLDVGMPEIDGFEIAKRIRTVNPRTKIIFVTRKEDLANMGYIYGAFRFVRKSKLDQELREAARSLRKFLVSVEDMMKFITNSGEKRINIKYIRYIEADGHSLILHGLDKERIYTTMREQEERLNSKGFIRIHKSFLVNFRFFYSLESKSMWLLSGEELPVSRNRVPYIKKRIRECGQYIDIL